MLKIQVEKSQVSGAVGTAGQAKASVFRSNGS